MKTLLIQTHELAKKLDPNTYTCITVRGLIGGKAGLSASDCRLDVCSATIMKMLYLEQKEDRNWAYGARGKFTLFEHVFSRPLDRPFGRFTTQEYKEIRQRLINSLLTRPDRTLCVLIPE